MHAARWGAGAGMGGVWGARGAWGVGHRAWDMERGKYGCTPPGEGVELQAGEVGVPGHRTRGAWGVGRGVWKGWTHSGW